MSEVSVSRIAGALRAAGLLHTTSGDLPSTIRDVADDSRAVGPGSLFVAIRGSVRDGHAFLSQARERGAVAAVVEEGEGCPLPALVVGDARRAAGIAAAVAFGEPARSLRIIGVTGTNGKTTSVGILRHLLDAPEEPSASIGTLGVLVGSAGRPGEGGAGLTTPGPVELQRVLGALVSAGVRTVAMEVSSHSLDQHRVDALEFTAALFTNLSRDHLDYHGSMEAYVASKAILVTRVAPEGTVIVNADDAAWRALPPAARRVTFGLSTTADVRAGDVRFGPHGSEWALITDRERHEVRLPLIGAFNVANALGAAAVALSLGLPAATIASRLARVPQVPGRLELLHQRPAVLRDYAHTPDALERALDAVRPFARGRVILVFGCGGDRDRGKRPEMGRIASRLADLPIVTSDNPRTEDPERILDDIEAGMEGTPHERVEDRREAIARALAIASPDDIVLLAGKGHETYQVRGTTKYPFDEQLIVRELLAVNA